jgi:hypothetical protein
MNYIYGDDCAKAVQEFRDLTKDFENERQWANKHLDLYKRICDKNDKLGTDLTITKKAIRNTLDFCGLYVIYNFDNDSDDNLHDAVLV